MMNKRFRRLLGSAIAMTAVALAATGCASGSNEAKESSSSTAAAAVELTPLTVQLAWTANAQSAGEFVALSKGFYQDAGLDVKFLPGGPNASPVQLVAAGAADMGVTYAPPIMLARNQGVTVKSFGAELQMAPQTYYSLASSNINSVEDWKGKKIGIQVGGEPFVKSILAKHGMSMDDVTLQTVGSDVNPLITGQVDLIAVWEINVGQVKPLESAGPLNKQRLFDEGVKFQSNYYIATDVNLESKTDEYAAFMKATGEGWRYAIDHPDETVDVLLQQDGSLSRDNELKALTTYMEDYVFGGGAATNGFGYMDPNMWRTTLEAFADYGIIKDSINLDDIQTDAVFTAADTASLNK